VQKLGTWTVEAGVNLVAPAQIQSDATGRAIPRAAGVRLGQIHADAVLGADAGVELKL